MSGKRSAASERVAAHWSKKSKVNVEGEVKWVEIGRSDGKPESIPILPKKSEAQGSKAQGSKEQQVDAQEEPQKHSKTQKQEKEQVIDLTDDQDAEDRPAIDTTTVQSPIRLFNSPAHKPQDNIDCISLKDLVSSPQLSKTYQFNFCINVDFFLKYITSDPLSTEICFINSAEYLVEMTQQNRIRFKLRHVDILLERFATHHTKMMVNFFRDGTAQIVVMSANMTEMDFVGNTQGLWMSPMLSKGNGRESSFKNDFLAYLKAYNKHDLDLLAEELKLYDFGNVKAEFLSSVPGTFTIPEEDDRLKRSVQYGYGKLFQLLKLNNLFPKATESTDILAQVATIASPFDFRSSNIFTHLLAPLINGIKFPIAGGLEPLQKAINDDVHPFKPFLVFPTKNEVFGSVLKEYTSGIFYNIDDSSHKVPFLTNQHNIIRKFMYRWTNSDPNLNQKAGRSNLAPHVKTYCASNDGFQTFMWYLLTSANLSKQAWGYPLKGSNGLKYKISSYEAGIFIHPKLYGEDYQLKPILSRDSFPNRDEDNVIPIRVPYAFPLEKYHDSDEPWQANIHQAVVE
ncbi:hypothetical protein LJB42_000268 [Komagataella kurtzmanii]|nr:hypothetical protein LJB42_000268 [Komagataella kurtzmanii]